MSRRAVLIVALALSSRAHAFAPTTDVYVGVEPNRVYHTDWHEQLRLADLPQWRKFIGGEGSGWQARFDERTGDPHRMWGPGIDVGADPAKGVMELVLRHPELTGLDPSALRLARVGTVDRIGRTWVDIDVMFDGAPIWRGGITARLEGTKVVMLGVDAYAHTPRVGSAVVSDTAAIAASIAQGAAPSATHTAESASLVWLPEEIAGEVRLRLCWLVRSETQVPRGNWVSFVDASSGELVAEYNEVRFANGTVTGEHEIRTVGDEVITSPLPLAHVIDGTESVYADVDGHFETTGIGSSLTTDLMGAYAHVDNAAGDEGQLQFAGPEAIWTEQSATQAEIHSYIFVHDVRAWGLAVAPEVDMSRDLLVVHVNMNQTCNAYYDGKLNFFKAGGGCNNSGRIADVVYHEWGHGFHYYSLQAGTWDGSLSEGAADVVAMLQTGDHVVAPGFMSNGDPIRDLESHRVYPEDYVDEAAGGDPHENGLIFAGAMWDLRQILNAADGVDASTVATTKIFTGLLKGGPTVEQSYDEAVFADDDNGNLADNTPNYCSLLQAFAPHGLGPNGSGGPVRALVEPTTTARSGLDIPIDPSVFNVAPDCFDWAPTTAAVSYRVNGGDWQSADLAVDAESATGAIPQQPEGSFIEYYVTFGNAAGEEIHAPTGAAIDPFSFYVGDVVPVYSEDFEAGDGGYTHELVSGKDSLGADDWQWGVPMGAANDPTVAFSGTHVWGNDLGDGDYNGEYQNQIENRLSSPPISTGHYTGVYLTYRRWLGVEDALYDHATITADGADVWENWGSTGGTDTTQDSQWSAQAIDLAGAADDGSVVLSWSLASDQGATFGGWTIDDVQLFAPATPDNRLGIDDFQAGDQEDGGITLTWTQPKHAPVERIVVVRGKDAFPTGPTDGDVVYDEAPEVGAPVSFRDEDVKKHRSYFYAVYAFDGTDWLSSTVEGLNADIGSTVGADPNDPTKKGCGCDTGNGGVAWLAVGLALVAARRRR